MLFAMAANEAAGEFFVYTVADFEFFFGDFCRVVVELAFQCGESDIEEFLAFGREADANGSAVIRVLGAFKDSFADHCFHEQRGGRNGHLQFLCQCFQCNALGGFAHEHFEPCNGGGLADGESHELFDVGG